MEQELTLPLAAQQAGMSADRMRRRVLSGEIAGRLVAGRWLIDGQSLAEFIRQREHEPVSAA
jgi:hypothetical protein